MPIRIASLSRRIEKNGALLHLAMTQRIESLGVDQEPSDEERALAKERQALKEERARRHAHALDPKPTALDRLVRTHHAEAKDKPKAKKEPKEAKAGKTGKPHPSRSEKHAAKAAAVEAARKAAKRHTKA